MAEPLDQVLQGRRLHDLAEQIADLREVQLRLAMDWSAFPGSRAHLAQLHHALYRDSYSDAGRPRREHLSELNDTMTRIESLTKLMPDAMTTGAGSLTRDTNRAKAFDMASQVYIGLAVAAPFSHGNQRVARVYTERLLSRAGLHVQIAQIPNLDRILAASLPGKDKLAHPKLLAGTFAQHVQGQRYDKATFERSWAAPGWPGTEIDALTAPHHAHRPREHNRDLAVPAGLPRHI